MCHHDSIYMENDVHERSLVLKFQCDDTLNLR